MEDRETVDPGSAGAACYAAFRHLLGERVRTKDGVGVLIGVKTPSNGLDYKPELVELTVWYPPERGNHLSSWTYRADEVAADVKDEPLVPELVKRAVIGLKRIGQFRYECGNEPHSLDCTLAGRVSRVFCCGMTRAIELCRMAGEDPEFSETAERRVMDCESGIRGYRGTDGMTAIGRR